MDATCLSPCRGAEDSLQWSRGAEYGRLDCAQCTQARDRFGTAVLPPDRVFPCGALSPEIVWEHQIQILSCRGTSAATCRHTLGPRLRAPRARRLEVSLVPRSRRRRIARPRPARGHPSASAVAWASPSAAVR